jgi:glycosyltransferase involved in cell wall biosynthesis
VIVSAAQPASPRPPAASWQWDGPTITFVAPWYGPRVPGGAEFQCRRNAEELARRGLPVEVFATTAGGLGVDWDTPSFPAGDELVNGVPVRRFPTRHRDAAAFDAINRRVLEGGRLSLVDEAVFVREIVGSDALDATIAAERGSRLYIFTPYMFGTSYWGARAALRPYFIPCFHDEGYAYMALYRQLIESAHGLLFYSAAEQRLANRVCRIAGRHQIVLGGGIETQAGGDAARFRRKFGLERPFLLYAGRRDVTKNTPLLYDYFRAYRAQGGQLRLALIGGPGEPPPADLLASGAAVDLGFLDQQDKLDAYAAAAALCQPSLNESFSVVLMEAWVAGAPGLVHSDCPVTREFCEASGGGLHFRSAAEFNATLRWIEANPAAARRMGERGRAYVREMFAWDAVLGRLLNFLRATWP